MAFDDRDILLRGVIANSLLFRGGLDEFACGGEVAQENLTIGGRKDRVVLDAIDRQFDVLESAVGIGFSELARFGGHDVDVRFKLLRQDGDVRFGSFEELGLFPGANLRFRLFEEGVGRGIGGLRRRGSGGGSVGDGFLVSGSRNDDGFLVKNEFVVEFFLNEAGETRGDGGFAAIRRLFGKIKGLIDRIADRDLIIGQDVASGDRESRAAVLRSALNELVKVLIRLARSLRSERPFDVGFATVGEDDRDRDRTGFQRGVGGTDQIGFAIATDRRKRIRINGGVAEFHFRFFRVEDRRGDGGGEGFARSLSVRVAFDEITARAVRQRAENVGVHDRADPVAAYRNARFDQHRRGFVKIFRVEGRARTDAATDKNDGAVGALVVIEGVGGDGEGFLKIGGAERVARLQAGDRLLKVGGIDGKEAVGDGFGFVRDGVDLNSRVLRKILDERIERVLRRLTHARTELRRGEVDQRDDVDIL